MASDGPLWQVSFFHTKMQIFIGSSHTNYEKNKKVKIFKLGENDPGYPDISVSLMEKRKISHLPFCMSFQIMSGC